MQNNFQSSPQKIGKVLIRHTCSTRINFFQGGGYKHPEANYLMKYSPKYYHSLTIEIKRHHPLLSHVKKIKKLKRFTGLPKTPFSSKRWLNLLVNNRKEIKEIPQIIPMDEGSAKPPRSFWRRMIKFFEHVTSLSLSDRLSKYNLTWRDMQKDYFESIKDLFVRYISKLRRLKDMKIPFGHENFHMATWILGRIKKMSRLERLIVNMKDLSPERASELFANKQAFLHVTDLNLGRNFYPVLGQILDCCKNLKSLSFDFSHLTSDEPQFLHFLISLQHLPGLINLDAAFSSEIVRIPKLFQPQASLQCLRLKLQSQKVLFGLENKPAEFVSHWKQLKELEELELHIHLEADYLLLVRRFITEILKKTQKLRLLKIDLSIKKPIGGNVAYQPFVIKEVKSLYKSLERLDLRLWSFSDLIEFDLEMLKPFRNLKELRLGGRSNHYKNIDQAVILLEGNQKKGEYPVLELKFQIANGWERNALKKIGQIKREDRNLKIFMILSFYTSVAVDDFESMISHMQSIKEIKGLEVCLEMYLPTGELIGRNGVKKIVEKYPQQMRNFSISYDDELGCLEYVKIAGEKAQIFYDER